MKVKQVLFGCKIATLLLVSAFTFVSCSDDEEVVTPSYVGTWVEGVYTSENAPLDIAKSYLEYRVILTLSTNSFEKNGQIKYPETTNWINYGGQKGPLSQSGNKLTLNHKEGGVQNFDDESKYAGITYVIIKEEYQFTTVAEWSVEGNILTLRYDHDGDGKFDGDNDDEIKYTRL